MRYLETVKQKFGALKNKENALILGIETSCDETAAAVVEGGRKQLSSVIFSQIDIHQKFGGVVPEIASRNHTLKIVPVIDEALRQAGKSLEDIDAIAVTYGAGLLGALLVGVSAAKALSYSKNIPLIKVNHIEAHIAANYIAFPQLNPPFTAVVASGGHTNIIKVADFGAFRVLGGTTDDAIGEAFDKTARVLGLPYPGGPEIDKRAKNGNACIEFFKKASTAPRKDLSLSYSGLKTAVINYVHNLTQKGCAVPVDDICASFNKTAVDLLVFSAVSAIKKTKDKTAVLAGGAAANSYLRERMRQEGEKHGFKTYCPPPALCTDNAGMVAARAFFSIKNGDDLSGLSLNAAADLRII